MPHVALSIATLTEYWLGGLDERTQAEVEEHLFACAACSASLQQLVAMGDAIRALSRKGGVAAVLGADLVRKLKAEGLRVREYSLQPGGSVNCTIAPEDDLVVAHVHAAFAGVEQLDVVFEDIGTGQCYKYADVAFNPGDSEIVFAPKASELRAYGKVTQRLRLMSVRAAGESVIGEYTFHHSPYPVP
jgi:hypothetical protein